MCDFTTHSEPKLFTIAIPTYNRAFYLDTCLLHITRQMYGYESLVEIIVSDNCSSDITPEVVQKHVANGFDINYIRNEINLGADKNIANCFVSATGKYVLVFGDDDILLDGAIEKIINTIKDEEFGLIYLNPFGYKTCYLQEQPATQKTGRTIYCDLNEFASKVNIMLTFLSGVVFNKSLVVNKIDPYRFDNTNLIQLNWVLSAMFSAKSNVIFEERLVAGKEDNTGGYELFKVFSSNLNHILKSFSAVNENKKFVDIINNALLLNFFPTYILNMKYRSAFIKEDVYAVLRGVFSRYLLFWVLIFPILKIPGSISLAWLKTISFWIRAYRKIRSVM